MQFIKGRLRKGSTFALPLLPTLLIFWLLFYFYSPEDVQEEPPKIQFVQPTEKKVENPHTIFDYSFLIPYEKVKRNSVIGVKSFGRANKIGNLLFSINKFYPDLDVIIMDDGKTSLAEGVKNYIKELIEKEAKIIEDEYVKAIERKNFQTLLGNHKKNVIEEVTLPILQFFDGIDKLPIQSQINQTISNTFKNLLQNVQIYQFPYDQGLAFGRNVLIEVIKTPHFVYVDDDFVFVDNTSIPYLITILEKTDVDLVGGFVRDRPEYLGFSLQLDGNSIRQNQTNQGTIFDCRIFDIVPNFFAAKVNRLRLIGWDNHFKIGEHEDFFLRAKGSLKIASCPFAAIEHNTNEDWLLLPESKLGEYARNRKRVFKYLNDFLTKHSLDKYISYGNFVLAKRKDEVSFHEDQDTQIMQNNFATVILVFDGNIRNIQSQLCYIAKTYKFIHQVIIWNSKKEYILKNIEIQCDTILERPLIYLTPLVFSGAIYHQATPILLPKDSPTSKIPKNEKNESKKEYETDNDDEKDNNEDQNQNQNEKQKVNQGTKEDEDENQYENKNNFKKGISKELISKLKPFLRIEDSIIDIIQNEEKVNSTFPPLIIQIINSQIVHERGEERYHGCMAGIFPICIFIDSQFVPLHFQQLYNNYLRFPDLFHTCSNAKIYWNNLRWTFIESNIGIETGFSFVGTGSIVSKKKIQDFLLFSEGFQDSSFIKLDYVFSLWQNSLPHQIQVELLTYENKETKVHPQLLPSISSLPSPLVDLDELFFSQQFILMELKRAMKIDQRAHLRTKMNDVGSSFNYHFFSKAIGNNGHLFITNMDNFIPVNDPDYQKPFNFRTIKKRLGWIESNFDLIDSTSMKENQKIDFFFQHQYLFAIDSNKETSWISSRNVEFGDWIGIGLPNFDYLTNLEIRTTPMDIKMELEISLDGSHWSPVFKHFESSISFENLSQIRQQITKFSLLDNLKIPFKYCRVIFRKKNINLFENLLYIYQLSSSSQQHQISSIKHKVEQLNFQSPITLYEISINS